MSLFWAVFLPSLFSGLCVLGFVCAARLHFLSRGVRSLERIDIPNEVKEVGINELQMLTGDEADVYFEHAWDLTRWERWKVTGARMRETRKWLHFVIADAVLFQEVARFQIQAAGTTAGDLKNEKQDLAFRVLDRASTAQFMATFCLGKLALQDFYRMVWPLYIPKLAGRFEVRGP